LNVALFEKFMREKYDRHLWSLLTSAPTDTPDVRRPRHPGLPTDLFTVASQRSSLFDTTIYRRNKYGLPCLRSKYGDVAPTKPVDITPRYSQTDTRGLDDDVLSTLRFRAHLANKAEVERRFSVCFDTGCTTSITNSLSDFEAPPVQGNFGTVRTMTGNTKIVAFGIVRWVVRDVEENERILRVPAFYLPSSDIRLLSPQSYANFHGWGKRELDCFGGNNTRVWLELNVD